MTEMEQGTSQMQMVVLISVYSLFGRLPICGQSGEQIEIATLPDYAHIIASLSSINAKIS
uniref:Secreted protein n=1 Tax=Heterorhabditis bacteriophora TaxID=37862 RepID=A0A1I7XMJ2_HETBA